VAGAVTVVCPMGLAGRVRHPGHRLGHGEDAAVPVRLVESAGRVRVDGIGSSQRLRVVRLATGHHTWHDIAILVIGLAARAFVTVTAMRRHRRRTAQRPAAAADGPCHNPS
jgi:hypothetical protein